MICLPRRCPTCHLSIAPLLIAVLAWGPGMAWGTNELRNVLLVVADDLSPTAGCYGNQIIETPHLDRLAQEGTRFTHAFCTTASCSASRSVMLTGLHNHATGQYGHAHGFHHFRSYDSVESLPKLLAKIGYHTARIGKYHVAPESSYPFETALPGNSRDPVAMARRCGEFFAHLDDRPFFLLFATSDPHRGGGKVSDEALAADRFGNREEEADSPNQNQYAPSDVEVPGFLPDTEVCRAELAQYYESVSRVDRGLGTLLAELERTGHRDDTLVLVTSDHGMAFPGAKTNLYEPGMIIPLIARLPGTVASARVSTAMVSLVDLAPTILDYAGALDPDRPEAVSPSLTDSLVREGIRVVHRRDFHGVSFWPVLATGDDSGHDEVYGSHTFHEIQMYYPMRVIRGRRFKLIWNIAHQLPFPFASDLWAASTWQAQYRLGPSAPYGRRTVGAYIDRAEFELYDLERDPHETTNLADDPAHADRLARLQTRLREFQKRTGDGWISKWDYE